MLSKTKSWLWNPPLEFNPFCHSLTAVLHFVGSLPTFSLPTFLLNLEDGFRRISVSTELFFTPFQDLFLKTCIELILLKALSLGENKFANVSFRKVFGTKNNHEPRLPICLLF